MYRFLLFCHCVSGKLFHFNLANLYHHSFNQTFGISDCEITKLVVKHYDMEIMAVFADTAVMVTVSSGNSRVEFPEDKILHAINQASAVLVCVY